MTQKSLEILCMYMDVNVLNLMKSPYRIFIFSTSTVEELMEGCCIVKISFSVYFLLRNEMDTLNSQLTCVDFGMLQLHKFSRVRTRIVKEWMKVWTWKWQIELWCIGRHCSHIAAVMSGKIKSMSFVISLLCSVANMCMVGPCSWDAEYWSNDALIYIRTYHKVGY